MNAVRNVSRLAIQSSRQFSTSRVSQAGKSEVHEGYLKLKDKQAKYQKDDGTPVYIIRGAGDKALFGVTILTCAVGLGVMGKLFYDLS